MDYNTVIERKLLSYQQKFGNDKLDRVKTDIEGSRHTKKLIQASLSQNAIPSGDNIISSVMGNFKYSFSNADTVEAAAYVLLSKWVNIANDNGWFLMDEVEELIEEIEFRIRKMKGR